MHCLARVLCRFAGVSRLFRRLACVCGLFYEHFYAACVFGVVIPFDRVLERGKSLEIFVRSESGGIAVTREFHGPVFCGRYTVGGLDALESASDCTQVKIERPVACHLCVHRAEPVDVLFNAHIAVAFLGHGVVFGGVVAHCFFEVVRHTVFVAVRGGFPGDDFTPAVVCFEAHRAYGFYERAFLAERADLVPDKRINVVVGEDATLRGDVAPGACRTQHRSLCRELVPRIFQFFARSLVVINACWPAIEHSVAVLVD